MATLHTVNKSPFDRNSLGSCLAMAMDNSSVLLIEDAVVAAVSGSAVSDQISTGLSSGIKFYVLSEDYKARGLSEDKLMSGIEMVDYSGFVDLTVENDRVQSWL